MDSGWPKLVRGRQDDGGEVLTLTRQIVLVRTEKVREEFCVSVKLNGQRLIPPSSRRHSVTFSSTESVGVSFLQSVLRSSTRRLFREEEAESEFKTENLITS